METQENQGNSRRDFFKKSAVGLGVAAVTVTGTAGIACALAKPDKPIVEGSFRQAVRRVRQAVIPTKACVRYDAGVGMWAVLDENYKPVRHFLNGVMTGVTFRSERVTKKVPGCGNETTSAFVGIAEGTLKENTYGTDHVGYRNLKFKEGHFQSYDEQEIRQAPVLALMPERHAMYKEQA